MIIRFEVDLGLNSLKGVLTLRTEDLYVEWRRYDILEAPVGPYRSDLPYRPERYDTGEWVDYGYGG